MTCFYLLFIEFILVDALDFKKHYLMYHVNKYHSIPTKLQLCTVNLITSKYFSLRLALKCLKKGRNISNSQRLL